MAKRGPKTKYNPEMLSLIEEMASVGHTDKAIYTALELSHDTFYRWIAEIPELHETLRHGRKALAQTVVPNLYRRAKGYRITEETSELKTNTVTGESAMVVTKRVTKHLAPDVSAIKFILTNWDEDWKERETTEHELPDGAQGLVLLPQGRNLSR